MLRIAKEEKYRYLDISRKDRLWGLFLNATGRLLHRMPGDPDPGHPPPYYYRWDEGRSLPGGYGVAYVTQGKGEFETEETGRQIVEAGTIFLLFPGVWHRYRPLAETGWSYHWLHFDGDYGQHLVRNALITPKRPILSVGLNGQILRPFLTLVERVESAPPGLQQLAAGNVMEILGSALAVPPSSGGDEELQSILRTAKTTLEQQVNGHVDLKHLANSFGMSYNYFRIAFRDYVGVAPYQFYLNLRLERAKELLYCSNMTIQEIALSLQFDSQSYFARLFRKKTGLAPSSWREQARERGGITAR